MRLINLTMVNIKRYMKNPMILIMTFVFPVAMLIGMFGTGANSSNAKIGVVNLDKSEYSNALVEKLSEAYDVREYEGTPQENYEDINDNKIGALYVIDKGFEAKIQGGEVPVVDVYKQEASAGAIIAEDTIDKFIKGKLQEGVTEGLSENYIETIIEIDRSKDKSDFTMSVLMICYFMLIGSSMITQDIIKLKTDRVLKRTICTGNSDIEVLGGMFGATFVLQTLLSSMAYVVIAPILKIQNANMGIAILSIALTSLVSTSIVVAATRWLKNQILANLGVVLFGLISFGLGMINIELSMFENVPVAITRLSVLSPFNWLIKILNDGEFIAPIIVILLMSGVFFTAGSFKLREFVKE